MILSVVVPACDRPASLKTLCARLLEIGLPGREAEVIVVDDSGSRKASEDNRESARSFTYERTPGRTGPAAARNRGAKVARGRWVAFLDDDVVPEEKWWMVLRKELIRAPSSSAGIEGAILPRGDGLWDREVSNLSGGLYLTGNMVYRRDFFFRAGGFDERFPGPFCEDQECALRIRKEGNIIFCPELVVHHQERSRKPWYFVSGGWKRMTLLVESEWYFFHKNPAGYREVRAQPDFRGTGRALCLKHTLVALRRRSRSQYVHHPFQAVCLFVASLIEQVAALFMVLWLRMRSPGHVQPQPSGWEG